MLKRMLSLVLLKTRFEQYGMVPDLLVYARECLAVSRVDSVREIKSTSIGLKGFVCFRA